MRLRSRSTGGPRVEMNMTPMIDVVFQLLTFFLVSFKIVQSEGDLAVKMPAGYVDGPVDSSFDVPIDVRLKAGANGELAGIGVQSGELANMHALRDYVSAASAGTGGPKINLICDDGLHYAHVMAALTAVSGRRTGETITPIARDVSIVSAK
jgi:biopolymer transport protein ExbD